MKGVNVFIGPIETQLDPYLSLSFIYHVSLFMRLFIQMIFFISSHNSEVP